MARRSTSSPHVSTSAQLISYRASWRALRGCPAGRDAARDSFHASRLGFCTVQSSYGRGWVAFHTTYSQPACPALASVASSRSMTATGPFPPRPFTSMTLACLPRQETMSALTRSGTSVPSELIAAMMAPASSEPPARFDTPWRRGGARTEGQRAWPAARRGADDRATCRRPYGSRLTEMSRAAKLRTAGTLGGLGGRKASTIRGWSSTISAMSSSPKGWPGCAATPTPSSNRSPFENAPTFSHSQRLDRPPPGSVTRLRAPHPEVKSVRAWVRTRPVPTATRTALRPRQRGGPR